MGVLGVRLRVDRINRNVGEGDGVMVGVRVGTGVKVGVRVGGARAAV